MKHVLVLNQFALPRSEPGGTRHFDLFTRLEHWRPLLVAGNINHYTQSRIRTTDPRFRLRWVPSYEKSSTRRIAGWVVFAAEAFWTGLRQKQVDVIYASSPQMLVPLAGWLVSRIRRHPLIVEVRDLWPETLVAAGALQRDTFLHRSLELLERFIYRKASHLVAVTPGWEDHFASLGVHLDRISVIPNGTEVRPITSDRESLRTRFGFDGLTAIYAGAHGPANGLIHVLDAAEAVPHVRFVLVGSGSEKPKLQAEASRRGLTNIEFRNPIPKEQLHTLLQAADIGIHCVDPLPVLQLGMSPNKIFDYMNAGIPFVSNAGEGLQRVIQPGPAGLIGPSTSLAANISQLAKESDAERADRGLYARNEVLPRFTVSRRAQQLEDVLDSVCGFQ